MSVHSSLFCCLLHVRTSHHTPLKNEPSDGWAASSSSSFQDRSATTSMRLPDGGLYIKAWYGVCFDFQQQGMQHLPPHNRSCGMNCMHSGLGSAAWTSIHPRPHSLQETKQTTTPSFTTLAIVTSVYLRGDNARELDHLALLRSHRKLEGGGRGVDGWELNWETSQRPTTKLHHVVDWSIEASQFGPGGRARWRWRAANPSGAS